MNKILKQYFLQALGDLMFRIGFVWKYKVLYFLKSRGKPAQCENCQNNSGYFEYGYYNTGCDANHKYPDIAELIQYDDIKYCPYYTEIPDNW